MSGCQNFTAFMAAEREGLKVAIADYRCLLSSQIGIEVGGEAAKQDFFDHLLSTFSLQFRRQYCKSCPAAIRCETRCRDKQSGLS